MSALAGGVFIRYRRRETPLHAARATVAAAYGASLATAALLLESPLILGALLLAVLAAAVAAGAGREVLRAARVSVLPILILSVLINTIVNRGVILHNIAGRGLPESGRYAEEEQHRSRNIGVQKHLLNETRIPLA